MNEYVEDFAYVLLDKKVMTSSGQERMVILGALDAVLAVGVGGEFLVKGEGHYMMFTYNGKLYGLPLDFQTSFADVLGYALNISGGKVEPLKGGESL